QQVRIALPPQQVDAQVARDGENPGGGGRPRRIERLCLVPDCKHGLLRQIFRRRGRESEAKEEALEPRRKITEQQRKLLSVFRAGDFNEARGPIRHGARSQIAEIMQPPARARPLAESAQRRAGAGLVPRASCHHGFLRRRTGTGSLRNLWAEHDNGPTPAPPPLIHLPLPSVEGRMKKIAIIGTGISGLSAAYLLSRSYDVTVYEKQTRLGGHSRTVDVAYGDTNIAVDTGFIVFNERNYPNLPALFRHLDVPVKNSDMSFALTVGNGWLEWGAKDL